MQDLRSATWDVKPLKRSLDLHFLILNNKMKGLDQGIPKVYFRTKTILELWVCFIFTFNFKSQMRQKCHCFSCNAAVPRESGENSHKQLLTMLGKH